MTDTESYSSRYQRVQAILDRAHLGSAASYQGFGKFWQLPLAQLCEMSLYGIRMIAPSGASLDASPSKSPLPSAPLESATKSCCASSSPAPSSSTPRKPSKTPGRGAASGLVRALRGHAPFDGSLLPRMPWGGGSYVSEDDVVFIEHWIDDGCPEQDDVVTAAESLDNQKLLANGSKLHGLLSMPVNQHRDDAGMPKLRKNVECLTTEELRRYRRAVATMKALDNYSRDERSFGYWARIHANNCQHGWEEFLPWHRLYLYYFEQRLQDVDPSITVPYWDWSASYSVNRSVNHIDTGTIPDAFCCFVDDTVLNDVADKVPQATFDALSKLNQPGRLFGSGPRLFAAAGLPYDDSENTNVIIAALEHANPLWHRFRWPGGESAANPTSQTPLLFEDYPAPEDIQQILGIENFFAFGSGPGSNHFFGALENIHNLLHNFSGGNNPNSLKSEPAVGDMVNNGVTAYDPIFWSHHSNVDRLWAEWQNKHPGRNPDNPTTVLAPWPGTVAQTLSVADLGYEYALSAHTFSTQATGGIAAFKSSSAQVANRVVQSHQRAEVRLEKVLHGQQGGILRVFLNQPDANEHTPTRGNDHFVGQVHLFGAECIGGPGHCDPPLESQRRFDNRPRHRKTPNHVRLDASATIRRLASGKESDFTVQVVALDLRGRPCRDVLRLSSVSLIFFD